VKVAIYTLTRDRLPYTQHCFDILALKAGYPYDHFVVDNGSIDGTVEWLTTNRDRFKQVHLNDRNYGNNVGNNQALSMIGTSNYDLIIRMDNDCEVRSLRLLASIVDLYTHLQMMGLFLKYVVSPRVSGIVNQPPRIGALQVNHWSLGQVAGIGGLFRIIPALLLEGYQWPLDMSIVAGEECVTNWLGREKGCLVCYVEDLEVYHYETTSGQEARFPEYHKRKLEEWNQIAESTFQMPEPQR
jgi:glycosyltransferase involved in cell wall biosynthesis